MLKLIILIIIISEKERKCTVKSVGYITWR